ncbi:MAG: hypothetical protein J5517_04320 [Eubacterium sp.]|nr:hypothetical protein [Eubacterium sp.]
MKRIVCEMCGSTDLIKHEGVFECQNCGTKYSVEEAKKMMIEGSVDVTGSTVKIDNSSSIDTYLMMAESAYSSNNKKEAENYCNKIIEIDPNNYKAWLLKGKAAGWQSNLNKIRMDEAINCFYKALNMSPPDELTRVKAEATKEVDALSIATIKLSCDSFCNHPTSKNTQSILYNLDIVMRNSLPFFQQCGVVTDGFIKYTSTTINNASMYAWNNKIWSNYWGTGHPIEQDLDGLFEQGSAAVALLRFAIGVNDINSPDNKLFYGNIITIYTALINAWTYKDYNGGYVKNHQLSMNTRQALVNEIMDCHARIKAIDPSYRIPKRPKLNSGGCYIATSVYGSYDCPEVWTLRRFRDYKLAKTWYGRAFIHIYYFISPTIVEWFGHTEWFKYFWKDRLDRLVKELQRKGYESTPYIDI